MSRAISATKFTLAFCGYALLSLLGFYSSAFTSPAWLAYSFILAPIYLVSVLSLVNLCLQHRHETLRYKRLWVYLSVSLQVIILLTSPASCYGWHQGAACYSFIQMHSIAQSLASMQPDVPHWSFVEAMFPIALLFHVGFVLAFLKTIKIETQ
jgi:hypothetical protein